MQKDVWDAPETDIEGASVTTPALANRSLLATDIPKDVFADFQANVGSYAAMGFAYMAFIMGFVFVASTALVVGIVPGVILENEIVMVIGGSLGFMVYAAIIMVFTAVGYPSWVVAPCGPCGPKWTAATRRAWAACSTP